jgi:hypothetical protein
VGRAPPDPGTARDREIHPIAPIVVHSATGRAFLGVRTCRNGSLEIVYDLFGVRRSVWAVIHGGVSLDGLQEACLRAINADDCLSTLHAALAKGGIRIECKEDRFGARL